MAARTYPNTPAGLARQLRDREHDSLTGRGHSIKWRRGHGRRWLKDCPGWTGRCGTCGDVIVVAAVDGGVYRTYEDRDGKPHSNRNCRGRRRSR